MTMKTSCISPAQWSNRDQHVSAPAATKAFGWGASSGTACAIWFLLDPKWVSVTRVLRLGVIRYGCASNGRKLLASICIDRKSFPVMCVSHSVPDSKLDASDLGRVPFRASLQGSPTRDGGANTQGQQTNENGR